MRWLAAPLLATVIMAIGCASQRPAADPSPQADAAYTRQPDHTRPGGTSIEAADSSSDVANGPDRETDSAERITTSEPPSHEADAAAETGGEDASGNLQPPRPAKPQIIQPFPHIAVNLTDRVVEIDGVACLDTPHWLEQVVCSPGTREHESLVVTPAQPSNIHAALLLAGYESGTPGRWHYDDEKVTVTPPQGDELDVWVRYENQAGDEIEEPIRGWIRDHLGQREFPDDPWVFAGSMLEENPPRFGGGEIYVADYSGSIIGLVTFGDEVIGFSDVLSDQADLQPVEWEVNIDAVPPAGTPVTVILKPFEKARTAGPTGK